MNGPHPPLRGIYSRAYTELVQPHRVWPVSKYFLRRWGPYLAPRRFWTVIAARQLAYLDGGKRDHFSAYDKQIAQEACTAKNHYGRLKLEMESDQTPLGLFVQRESVTYRRKDGVTRPGPTGYTVRLDDPLTPADSIHLTLWLQAQAIPHTTTAVQELLQRALNSPTDVLIAPSLKPYLTTPPARYEPILVTDIVDRVFGRAIGGDPAVRAAADALHTHLTGQTYLGSHYFRRNWVKALGAGPAYLVTYLRSYCYANEESGELRNQVTMTQAGLAAAMDIDRATLFRWLKKIATKAPDQALGGFLSETGRQRTASNDVEVTWQINLAEPLTPSDLAQYTAQLNLEPSLSTLQNVDHTATIASDTALQFEDHTQNQQTNALLQNVDHREDSVGQSTLQFEDHTTNQTTLVSLQNDDHQLGIIAKCGSGQGGTLQNKDGLDAKCGSSNPYKTLFEAIKKEQTEIAAAVDFQEALWHLQDNQAHLSFAAVIAPTWDAFFHLVGIAARKTQAEITSVVKECADGVAWYLYTLTQDGLTTGRLTTGYLVNQLRYNTPPPAPFAQLARLSWAEWRSLALLNQLMPAHELIDHIAAGKAWLSIYGDYRPVALPFDVGADLDEATIAQWQRLLSPTESPSQSAVVAEATDKAPVTDAQRIWQVALDELALQMPRQTFDAWLRDSAVVDANEEQLTIGVRNAYARDWLAFRLEPIIVRTVTSIAGRNQSVAFEIQP